MTTSIEIDFEVYKALTLERSSESESYNDVLRKLLKLGPAAYTPAEQGEWLYKGVKFPVGTALRGRYKGKEYKAEVEPGGIRLNGRLYHSPSSAAIAVTGSPTNGWVFWQAKIPGMDEWRSINLLRAAEQA